MELTPMNAPLDRGPTPETRAKAREGVIGLLEKRKFLWPEHVEAAWLIEDGYRAFTNPVSCRLMRFEHEGWLHRRPETIANMTARLVDIVHDYFAWSEHLVEHNKGNVHAVTMDIVIDGHTLSKVHRDRSIGINQVKHVLRDGLTEYAKITGRLA